MVVTALRGFSLQPCPSDHGSYKRTAKPSYLRCCGSYPGHSVGRKRHSAKSHKAESGYLHNPRVFRSHLKLCSRTEPGVSPQSELNRPENSCRQHHQRTHKGKHAVNRNAEQPEWQKQNPDQGIENQCTKGDRPACDEQ